MGMTRFRQGFESAAHPVSSSDTAKAHGELEKLNVEPSENLGGIRGIAFRIKTLAWCAKVNHGLLLSVLINNGHVVVMIRKS